MEKLIESIITELDVINASLADGITLMDLPVIIEATCRVARSTSEDWDTYSDSRRVELIISAVLAIDERTGFIERISAEIVSWDIPWLPDQVIDAILNERVIANILRGAMSLLVTSAMRHINRRALADPRAWDISQAAAITFQQTKEK